MLVEKESINNTVIKITKANRINNITRKWMNIQSIENNHQLTKLYNKVCLQHSPAHKWILMINPEGESLEQLANQHDIDVSKILRVDTKNSSITLSSLTKVLNKGNCSAIILANTDFKQEEISHLSNCAQQGNTQCIVLNNVSTALH